MLSRNWLFLVELCCGTSTYVNTRSFNIKESIKCPRLFSFMKKGKKEKTVK